MIESSKMNPETVIIGDDGISLGHFQMSVTTVREVDKIYEDLARNFRGKRTIWVKLF